MTPTCEPASRSYESSWYSATFPNLSPLAALLAPLLHPLANRLTSLLELAVGQLVGVLGEPHRRLHAGQVDLHQAGVDADVGRDAFAVPGGEVPGHMGDL